jgi:uncharacterized membrane protein
VFIINAVYPEYVGIAWGSDTGFNAVNEIGIRLCVWNVIQVGKIFLCIGFTVIVIFVLFWFFEYLVDDGVAPSFF